MSEVNTAHNNFKKQLFWFAGFFVTFESIVYMANDMIMPSMIEVTKEFGVSVKFVAMSLTVYILGNTILQLFLGPLADRYGKKRLIIIGNFLFLVFSILMLFSTNISYFLIIRLFEGMGCAFVAMGYAVIHDNFNDKDAVKVIALMGNITILAPILGPVFGGAISHSFGWRAVFIVISVVSFVTLIGLTKHTPKNDTRIPKISLPNIFSTYYKILKDKNFIQGVIPVCLAIIILLGWIGVSPVIIMENEGLSYGYYMAYQIIALGGIAIASILLQFLPNYMSAFKIMVWASFFFVIGQVISLFVVHNPTIVAIDFFISSFGMGLFNAMAIRIVMSDCKFSRNMTMSLFIFIETIAMGAGVAIINSICYKFNYSLESFVYSNVGIAVVAGVMMLNFAFLNRKRDWK